MGGIWQAFKRCTVAAVSKQVSLGACDQDVPQRAFMFQAEKQSVPCERRSDGAYAEVP